jgi:hypothetical protein
MPICKTEKGDGMIARFLALRSVGTLLLKGLAAALIGAACLSALAGPGSVRVIAAAAYETDMSYYDQDGNLVGEKDRFCIGPNVYTWGDTTSEGLEVQLDAYACDNNIYPSYGYCAGQTYSGGNINWRGSCPFVVG